MEPSPAQENNIQTLSFQGFAHFFCCLLYRAIKNQHFFLQKTPRQTACQNHNHVLVKEYLTLFGLLLLNSVLHCPVKFEG